MVGSKKLHVTLFSMRRVSRDARDAAKAQLERVRAAWRGVSFGAADGTRVVLKLKGTPYDDAHCRTLASAHSPPVGAISPRSPAAISAISPAISAPELAPAPVPAPVATAPVAAAAVAAARVAAAPVAAAPVAAAPAAAAPAAGAPLTLDALRAAF